jgi:predicted fused transcriptional regulator/phosphomethylpyrimidine kinase
VQAERVEEMSAVERQLPEILCNICYVLSANYCEEECGHAFCLDCMKGYLRENIRSGNYIIKCPEFDCPEHVSVAVVRTALNEKELERFLYFRDKNEKEMNPDNKFCSK